jgi:two-component system LytT family response regulator
MTIRVIVADDQPMARERLRALLSEERDVDVIATAATGLEAANAIARLQPDLVFLDIQMPELNGIEVVEAIGADRMPITIFVTAYDEYAVQAFEVNAVDYLLKPFGRERLQKALERVRRQFERRHAGAAAQSLLAAVDALRPTLPSSERLLIKADGRVTFIELDAIDWFEAEGNYVRIHSRDETHLVRDTLKDLHARAGTDRFFRIHRSRVVNVSRIRGLSIAAGGDYDVILTDGTTLGLSRLYKDSLQQRMARGV